MAIFWDAAVEPDDLTTFTREVPTPSELGFLGMFPTEYEDDNTVDFAEIVRTNRTARFRSFDGRVHVSRRDAGSERRVKLLPLSSSLSMGELERLHLEFARTGGTRTELMARAAYNDAEQLTREVQNRLEQAWGDVIADGKLTINENGYAGEADFGLPANHNVAPATAWSDTANATVLTDIESWNDTYRATNGTGAAQMKTSQAVLRNVRYNKEVIDAIYGSTQGRTRVSITELNDLLVAEGLPTFGTPYETSVDVDGTTTRVFPADRIAMLPADLRTLGYTAFGVTATALELVNSDRSDMSFEEAPGIAGVVIKEDGVPFRQYTYVDATAMPILADAKKLLVGDVQ